MSGSRASLWLAHAFASWLATCCAAQVHAQALVQVPMDDGVTLATDVWRSDDVARPVLLRRTPYGRALARDSIEPQLAAGFHVVSQDVRGRGASAGIFLPFATDEADGRATIDWIAAQPWSNGKVGTFSGSAEGVLQYQAMAAAPRALACASILVATHDVHRSWFPGGAWRPDLGSAWLTSLGATSVIGIWRAHEVRDAFWDPLTLSRDEMARIRYPVLIVGGLFDVFAPEQARIAHELPQLAPDVTVILGPWTHGGYRGSAQGELRYPEAATLPTFDDEERAFFASCLQNAPRHAQPKVRYYLSELGDARRDDGTFSVQGEWRESELWPPADVGVEALYLVQDNQLASVPGDSARVDLPLDPRDPLPSQGGANYTTRAGPYEQTELDRRPDVYVAASARLSESVELVGTPRAWIWAASATDDIDVVVRFEQVTPSGAVIAFADGLQRGRFVRSFDAIRALTPGEPTLFEVELGPIALRVSEGAALRVAISGASAPRYEPNPNRALPLLEAGPPLATTLSIYRDAAHPSRIELPVLRGALPRSAIGDAGLDPETARDASAASDAALRGVRSAGCRLADERAGLAPGLLTTTIALLVRRLLRMLRRVLRARARFLTMAARKGVDTFQAHL